jgi:ubiquitin-conjugating enzyme E2 I
VNVDKRIDNYESNVSKCTSSLTLVLINFYQERKTWRKDHPPGFFIKPAAKADGSSDLFQWKGGIPGKAGTDWEGGVYKIRLQFNEDYPSQPPQVYFDPPIFHPNIFPDGKVCLSILSKDWRPAITLKQILMGLQDLLDNPNNSDAAQRHAYEVYRRSKTEYSKKVREQAKRFTAI